MTDELNDALDVTIGAVIKNTVAVDNRLDPGLLGRNLRNALARKGVFIYAKTPPQPAIDEQTVSLALKYLREHKP